jgi:hypothetical protein
LLSPHASLTSSHCYAGSGIVEDVRTEESSHGKLVLT